MSSVLAPSVRRFATKETTGIPGLPVVVNAREVMQGLYKKTIEDAQELPDVSGYKHYVIKLCQDRLAAVEANESVEDIENAIASGQVEELIVEAEDELKCLEMMKEWKPWDLPPHDWEEGEPTPNITGEILPAYEEPSQRQNAAKEEVAE